MPYSSHGVSPVFPGDSILTTDMGQNEVIATVSSTCTCVCYLHIFGKGKI